MRLTFPNGWVASIIDTGYGADEGLMEVGVIHPDGGLCYGAIAAAGHDAVIGWLDGERLSEVLDQIAVLPSDEASLVRARIRSDNL